MNSFFLAQIAMFAGNFAPRNWAFCDGQLLPISQNTALFSLLGTTYGGDGRTTFKLPEMRGRAPMGAGTGPGLPSRRLGESLGTQDNVMNITTLAAHNHTRVPTSFSGTINMGVNEEGQDSTDPSSGVFTEAALYSNQPADGTYAHFSAGIAISEATNSVGNNQAINNMMPYLTLNFIICMSGRYPSRS